MTTLRGQDVTRWAAKQFGGLQATPAFPGPMECTVVSATDTQVVVTVTGFDSTGRSTFTCDYEPRFTWTGGTKVQITPPAGTACVFVVPANSTTGTPWVTTFSGWPT